MMRMKCMKCSSQGLIRIVIVWGTVVKRSLFVKLLRMEIMFQTGHNSNKYHWAIYKMSLLLSLSNAKKNHHPNMAITIIEKVNKTSRT